MAIDYDFTDHTFSVCILNPVSSTLQPQIANKCVYDYQIEYKILNKSMLYVKCSERHGSITLLVVKPP